jgi:hypothetical protein
MSLRAILRPMRRWPILGPAARMARRLRVGLAYVGEPGRSFVAWALSGTEESNFTYDLTGRNREHLAAFVSQVTGIDWERAGDLIHELEQDAAFQAHVGTVLPPDGGGRAARARPGRRLGWYAIARALRPALVVETGVDQGLGACVLAAAVLRNRDEGHPGRYLGTDIDPAAGRLFSGPYAATGRMLYGDSLESLRRLEEPIDLFINDSDHSAEYEAREYAAVEHLLSERAVVLADNAHATDELLRFARRTGRQFLFFHEQPAGHWYPGAGIGAAFRRGW